jgi:putative FmdB family regulatory protein
MPTYVYDCDHCGCFEAFQIITEAPLTRCPAGHTGVRRVISGGAGVLFRGPGFYATDYRSREYRKAARKEHPEPSQPQGAAKGRTDSS